MIKKLITTLKKNSKSLIKENSRKEKYVNNV